MPPSFPYSSFNMICHAFPFLAVFTVYSWRVVFAYYRVLACNGGVELDSDASGYGADALNGGSGQGCNSIDI